MKLAQANRWTERLKPLPKRKQKDQKSMSTSIRSIDRAISLLEILAREPGGYRLTDICTQASLSLSTAHRILTTLENRRFVRFDQTTRQWLVGKQSFIVGSAFLRETDLIAHSVTYLRLLRDQSRETASMGVVHDGEMIVVAQSPSREISRALTAPGGRVPVFTSGLGRAILSTYSERDLLALGQNQEWRYVSKGASTAWSFTDELKNVREIGYVVDDERASKGLRCVAAPVFNASGEAIAAISVSASIERLGDRRVSSIGRLVKETALELTDSLGGKLPEM